MSRTQRLFDLIQLLRRHRYPISAQDLASELQVSVRTLYRDIVSLKAQGAEIEGEPGVGYVLRPSFMLPPLMFSHEELEALVLGSRWVSKRADKQLAVAADNALTKIAAVLPNDLRLQLELSSLLIGPSNVVSTQDQVLQSIRDAVRAESKLEITYQDSKESNSNRIVWPIGLVFFDQVRILVAWCELRCDFRHFRADRILAIKRLPERYPKRKANLMREWRKQHNIPPA